MAPKIRTYSRAERETQQIMQGEKTSSWKILIRMINNGATPLAMRVLQNEFRRTAERFSDGIYTDSKYRVGGRRKKKCGSLGLSLGR